MQPLCPFTNLHCRGNDHLGMEPLCPFTTVHCRQWSPRCGTPVPPYYCAVYVVITIVVTGRARLLGFRVEFVGQNPSLRTLRLSGFGPFWASAFFGLCQAFVDHVKHEVDLFSWSCVSCMLFFLIKSSLIPRFIRIKTLRIVFNLTMDVETHLTVSCLTTKLIIKFIINWKMFLTINYLVPLYCLYVYASILQASWVGCGKQQQEQTSPNHTQAMKGCPVSCPTTSCPDV